MSTFDPDTFMNSQTTDANDTRLTPVDEGEYPGAIVDVSARSLNDKAIMTVKWLVDSNEAREATGLYKPTVKQDIWLDLLPGGGLDNGKGKNVGLGKLRAALGQNTPGRPWSPGMLVGQVAMIKVAHRADKNDPEVIYAEVKSVAAM